VDLVEAASVVAVVVGLVVEVVAAAAAVVLVVLVQGEIALDSLVVTVPVGMTLRTMRADFA
jgi:hypothetical protein